MNTQTHTDTSTREIVTSRVFDAPRELVFKAWSNAEHLDQWWGPEGFRNETLSMDFRVGGAWRYIMHGPNDVDFPNRIDYTAIIGAERISYDHSDDQSPPIIAFQGETTFVDLPGKTEVTMRSIFATAEERDRVVAEYGAVEGGKQTLARLATYLQTIS